MKLPLTLDKAESLILEACKSGQFEEDFYFGDWPHVSARLLADRKLLIEAVELVLGRIPSHTPNAIKLLAALDEVKAGWPTEADRGNATS